MNSAMPSVPRSGKFSGHRFRNRIAAFLLWRARLSSEKCSPLPDRATWWPSATWIPGNWATDLGGGSRFGYTLLSAVLISSLMAIFLQALSAKLGIATGRDLAQACREHYSRRTTLILWVLCEIAIAACDLAEVLGSAIASETAFRAAAAWPACCSPDWTCCSSWRYKAVDSGSLRHW